MRFMACWAALALLTQAVQGQTYLQGPLARLDWDHGAAFRWQPNTPVAMDPDTPKFLRERVADVWRTAGLGEPEMVARLTASEDDKAVYVGVIGEDVLFQARVFDELRAALRDELPGAYAIWVSEERAAVAGNSARGLDNALAVFAEYLGAFSRNWPEGRLTVGPSLRLRGVMTDEPVSRSYAEDLAAEGGNFILFTDAGEAAQRGDGLGSWKAAFAMCRDAGLEPAPVIALPGYDELERRALSGGVVRERLRLTGDEWVALGMRNVVPGSVRVTSGDVAYERGQDFGVEDRGELGCVVWRLIGGAIESGDLVTVTYRFTPLEEDSLPLGLTELCALLREPMDRALADLEPRWLHLGAGPRSRLAGERGSYLDIDLVAFLDAIAKEHDGRVRLMLWGAAAEELRDAAGEGVAEPVSRLPVDLVTAVRLSGLSGSEAREAMERAADLNRPVLAVTPATELDVHQAGVLLAEMPVSPAGLLVRDTEALAVTSAVETALRKGWDGPGRAPAWPAGLNTYFRARLARPAFGEALAAMAAHLNRQTLRGVSPEEERRRFERAAEAVGRRTGEDDPGLALARAAYGHLLRYLEMEYRYSVENDAGAVDDVAELVVDQAAIDPEFSRERQERIVETVQTKDVFVPSTVVFGLQIMPYREVDLPDGAAPLEVLAEPEYHDEPHRASAVYDLQAETGPIFRADLETAGAAELRLETSADGEYWEASAVKRSERRGGVRPPLMLTTPVVARYVRVVVEAPAGQAVLRRARLTAWKHEPVAGAPARLRAPTVDGEFKEEAWAGMRPQVEGFVSAERGGLADPPTTVYLCRTEEALFVAAYMREDRPDTMVAAKTRRDAALWEEESFEVRLKPGSGEPLRFIVNPRGARYEALGQDAGWNGAWTAATRRYPGGWSAELRLPYETLGVRGVPGASWQADFIRRRKNVREETSSWAYRGQRRWRGEAWGRLLLE